MDTELGAVGCWWEAGVAVIASQTVEVVPLSG